MENTKDVILNAAQSVFKQKGFDGASVELIAKEAGVAKSSLYYHFKNKDEILSEVLERVFVKHLAYLKDCSLDENNIADEDWLTAFLEKQFDFIASQREVFSIALSEALKANAKNDNPIFEIPIKTLQELPIDVNEETKLMFGFFGMAYAVFICIDEKASRGMYNNLSANMVENIIKKGLVQLLATKMKEDISSSKDVL